MYAIRSYYAITSYNVCYTKLLRQLYVEGKLKTRTYDDKDGIKRYVTEIYADNIQMLGRRPEATTNDETSYVRNNFV